jgi:hypothetical protein
MKNLKLAWIAPLIFMLALASCNFPLSGNGGNDANISTIVALQVAQTQMAQTLAVGQASPTSQQLAQEPTFTPTITLTPQPSATPTLEGVWLTVVENTNCRSGPGIVYDLITTIKKDQKVQALARNPDNDYYYIQNPNGGGFCWLWDQYSTLSGNITILPVFTPQPTPTNTITPTPAPGISLSYKGLITCMGQYAINVYIKNTGSVTWQSVKMVVVDTDTASTFTHTLDSFRGYNGCAMDLEQEDLTPGEEGVVSNVSPGQFGYDPTGHKLKVTITVYSKNGLAGESFTSSIKITP